MTLSRIGKPNFLKGEGKREREAQKHVFRNNGGELRVRISDNHLEKGAL